MVVGKKSQAAMVGLMIGIFILMMGLIFIDPIKDVITEVRGTTQLDCSNSTISDGNKMTCLVVDLTLPYFIVVVFSLAGGWMAAKFV